MEYDEQEEEEIEEDEQEDREEEDEEGDCLKGSNVAWNQVHYTCKHAVENSSRFSLRVMEAMRFLQSHENVLPISSVKEIVDYIEKNYNNDGDLHAQVRTALKQLCVHGFVVEALKDEYQLIGPFGSSAISEMCNCDLNLSHSQIHFNTPKRKKLRRTFNNKLPLCHCDKLGDEPELEMKRKESMIFSGKNISPLSRMNNLNTTLLRTPKDRLLRSVLRGNNSKMHSTTENGKRCERSAYEIRAKDVDKSREQRPKRISNKRDDIPEVSRIVQQYDKADLTPTDQINGNHRDSIFQEIKNLVPSTSKIREKELRKWIQRCRRECERQNE